jgi:hypothetical protein
MFTHTEKCGKRCVWACVLTACEQFVQAGSMLEWARSRGVQLTHPWHPTAALVITACSWLQIDVSKRQRHSSRARVGWPPTTPPSLFSPSLARSCTPIANPPGTIEVSELATHTTDTHTHTHTITSGSSDGVHAKGFTRGSHCAREGQELCRHTHGFLAIRRCAVHEF